jgi:hypothetical protein
MDGFGASTECIAISALALCNGGFNADCFMRPAEPSSALAVFSWQMVNELLVDLVLDLGSIVGSPLAGMPAVFQHRAGDEDRRAGCAQPEL